MDPNFWRERWKQGQHGFHRTDVNPALVEHWPRLGLDARASVFVPLCGKSLDLWWLRDRGHSVIGVELSPIAVHDFFAAAKVEPKTSRQGPFAVSETAGLRILQGDFFDLRPADLGAVRAVYDRAALIALPPNLRLAYARALKEKLPRPLSMLLLTFESSKPELQGPPFTVLEPEVRELYEPAFRVELLHRGAFTEVEPHLRGRGHEAAADAVYLLEG